jgi:hypothetical protein
MRGLIFILFLGAGLAIYVIMPGQEATLEHGFEK